MAKLRTVDAIIAQLKTALAGVWDRQTRELLIGLLGDARALGLSGAADRVELDRIFDAARSHLGVDLQTAASAPVLRACTDAYGAGFHAVGTGLSFTLPDLDAIAILRDQSSYWVRNAYSRALEGELESAMIAHFRDGITRVQIAARLEAFLAEKNPAMKGYFDLLADHTVTTVAEIARTSGYVQAGVEYVEIVAVLDDRTSPVCRHLHGRIIPVSAMSDQRDAILDAAKRGDYRAAEQAHTLYSGERAMALLLEPRTSKLVASGVGLPPYHFRCRTTTVAHFQPADYWQRASHWAIDGDLPREERSRLVDYARNARWGTHTVPWPLSQGGDGRKHPTSYVHYQRHGVRHMKMHSMIEYNSAAADLIRRGGREIYLVIENKQRPWPVLLFHDPVTRELAVVNVKGQQLASYYLCGDRKLRKKLAKQDAVLKLPKGVTKWTNFGNS